MAERDEHKAFLIEQMHSLQRQHAETQARLIRIEGAQEMITHQLQRAELLEQERQAREQAAHEQNGEALEPDDEVPTNRTTEFIDQAACLRHMLDDRHDSKK